MIRFVLLVLYCFIYLQTTASDKSTTTVSKEDQVFVKSEPKSAEIPKYIEAPRAKEPVKPVQVPLEVSKLKDVPKLDTVKHVDVKREVEVTSIGKPSGTTKSTESSSQFSSSKTEFLSSTSKTYKEESKTVKFERTTPVPFSEPTTFTKTEHTKEVRESDSFPTYAEKQTAYEIIGDIKPTEVKSEETTEETGIQTSSITKQQSLDYFMKKMKEGEETVRKELPKVTPIKQELYTKFEDVSKEKRETPVPKSVPHVTQVEKSFVSTSVEPSTHYEKIVTKDVSQSFVPFKSERVQSTEQSYSSKMSSSSQSYQKFSSYSSSTDKKLQVDDFHLEPEPPAEICYPTARDVKKTEEVSEKSKQLHQSFKEIERAEIPVPKASPKIGPPKQQTFEQKTQVTSEFYKSESAAPIYKPQTDFATRPISPRPSTEAIEMEKLWTSQRSTETERPVSSASSTYSIERQTYTRPLSAMSGSSMEINLDAVAMEKSWAHKTSESNIQKSWPPPPSEQKRGTPSWSVQSTLEKKWTPSTGSSEIKSEVTSENKSTVERRWAPTQETSFKETVVRESALPQDVPHYIAEVTHQHNINEQQLSQASIRKESSLEVRGVSHVEETSKPSEIIKSWPPKSTVYEDTTFKTSASSSALESRPISTRDIAHELYLEPGPPPEIGFAQPPKERKQSYVEIIEQDLEKNLEKVPSKVLPGSVRTIPPPPLPPKKELPQAPPLPARPTKFAEPSKKVVEVISKPFERFPDLEPFPFRPSPERPKPPRVGPPPTPSKFIKGRFTDSDYESDFESVRIQSKWRPYASDTEEPTYRRVQPPKSKPIQRSRSTEKQPVPPSQFERPPQFEGPPRPVIDFETSTMLRKEAQSQRKEIQTKHYTKRVQSDVKKEVKKEISPPDMKPGSPPIFVQAEPKPKPPSPKLKQKIAVDGYMADTDEPFTLRHKKTTKTEHRHEERTEHKQFYQSSQSSVESTEQKTSSVFKPVPPKISQHKRHVQSTAISKKVRSCAVFVL